MLLLLHTLWPHLHNRHRTGSHYFPRLLLAAYPLAPAIFAWKASHWVRAFFGTDKAVLNSRVSLQAWLISFFISVLQDLLVSETIVIAWKTAVGALIFPNIAAFLADRIARKYKGVGVK